MTGVWNRQPGDTCGVAVVRSWSWWPLAPFTVEEKGFLKENQ